MARVRQRPGRGIPAADPQANEQQAARYFVCSTDRDGPGTVGNVLELLMRQNNCAAMWQYESGDGVRYPDHMAEVCPGDLIFMFARGGPGIIGVGRALGSRVELAVGAEGRIRPEWQATEWQVPVEWIRWQPDTPCQIQPLRSTFQNISGPRHVERRAAVIQHFHL